MALLVRPELASPRRRKPYATRGKQGRAIFCVKRRGPTGYTRPLTKREPSAVVVVVSGASHPRRLRTRADAQPVSLSRIEVGRERRSTAGTSRPEISTNTGVDTNGPRHHRSQRRLVRAGTPVARVAALAIVCARATTLATITIAPT
jgi:hypothetical protein